jgi:hypothetical protein
MRPRRLFPFILCLTGCLPSLGCTDLSAPAASTQPARPQPVAISTPAPSNLASVPEQGTAPTDCRLPVASHDAPMDGHPDHGTVGHGGFIRFHDLTGTFVPDPNSMGAYDRAVARWLPVPRAWVLPDGSAYAYADPGAVHVVAAASGVDRQIPVPGTYHVLDFTPQGIFVTPGQGLALLDPSRGTLHQITGSGTWTVIGDGVAFGADLDPGDASPFGSAPDRIQQLDLATGAISTYRTFPGHAVELLGVRGRGPIFTVSDTGGTSVVVGGQTIAAPSVANEAPPAVTDGNTIWFSGHSGAIARWDGTGAPRFTGDPRLEGDVLVAGVCR